MAPHDAPVWGAVDLSADHQFAEQMRNVESPGLLVDVVVDDGVRLAKQPDRQSTR